MAAAAPQTPQYRAFKAADLAAYTGEGGSRIYIAVDGLVFDMCSHEGGPAFYGPGGGYSVFAGKDATIGLATMQTDPSQWSKFPALSKDLSASQKDTLGDWLGRFRAKYAVVGCCVDGARPTTLAELPDRLA